jgi:thioredoxin 1
MSENTVEVTNANFEEVVVNSKTPVLVDFWAEWCGPCKMVAPILDEIATEQKDNLTIGKLDVDANQSTAMAYGVSSIPTMMLFKDGQPIERIVGFQPKQQLMKKLQPHLSGKTVAA